MKSRKSQMTNVNERAKFILLTLLSGGITGWFIYLFQPGRLNGSWVILVLFALVVLIPLTATLFVSSFFRHPSAMFKTIGNGLAEIFSFFIP